MSEPPALRWDQTVDLLVFGAGAGGMTAAVVAASEGLSVLLCEKYSQLGGTTATSAGTVWIPAATQGARIGTPDSLDTARVYLKAELGAWAAEDKAEAFLSTAATAIDYLEARTDVVFDAVRSPDYHLDQPGATNGGRALTPRSYDGRKLGADFALLRPPRRTLMIFGGMMIGRREVLTLLKPFVSFAAFRHVASILVRQALDRLTYPRGTRLLLGNAMVARFIASLRRAGASIETNASLAELILENGQVVGAAMIAKGMRRLIRARVGVVLATGGFPGSAALRAQLFGDIPNIKIYAFEESCGDGLNAALQAGAVLDKDHASSAFWTPVSVHRTADGQELIWAHHSLDRPNPGLIAVNSAGRRFVNEADSYHDFVIGMLQAHKDAPSIPAYLICDRRFLKKYGLGLIKPLYQRLGPYLRSGYLVEAESLSALARRLGIDPNGLEATVAENNRQALSGRDDMFGKGGRSYNRYYGDPTHGPNPCIGPIDRAPYYAVAVYPGVLGTSIGLRTDIDARALGRNGVPIAGLYVCGNDAASVMRGTYPGPGITLGPAVTFAYRAAMHAKQRL